MTPTQSPRRSKTEKLLAVFERFHARLGSVKEEQAERLCENWRTAKAAYAKLPNVPRPTVMAGLEQGLRELPGLLQSLSPKARVEASRALRAALESEFPEFLAEQQERLAKIVGRGKIQSESEFYLIRHQIDVFEGMADRSDELDTLYDLVEKFGVHS